MRDLQVVQELDQRRADQDEERDVRQPAERVAPAEVVLEQPGTEHRARECDEPGGSAAAQVAGRHDRQDERQ